MSGPSVKIRTTAVVTHRGGWCKFKDHRWRKTKEMCCAPCDEDDAFLSQACDLFLSPSLHEGSLSAGKLRAYCRVLYWCAQKTTTGPSFSDPNHESSLHRKSVLLRPPAPLLVKLMLGTPDGSDVWEGRHTFSFPACGLHGRLRRAGLHQKLDLTLMETAFAFGFGTVDLALSKLVWRQPKPR